MENNEIAVAESFSVALANQLNDVSMALPENLNKERFIQNCLAVMNGNTTLIDFAKKVKNGAAQIRACMVRAAIDGLDVMNKEVHLVPFGNTLNYMISYKGKRKICKEHAIRPVKDIYAKLVREGDEYEQVIINGEQSVNFKPKPFNNGDIQGAFAVCLFEDGGVLVEEMSLEDLENVRSCSKQSKGPIWSNHTGEMYRKTVLHRLCKNIELEFNNPEQQRSYDEDMEIETDPLELAKNKINEEANTVDFEPIEGVIVDET